jgi:hypothetical protein
MRYLRYCIFFISSSLSAQTYPVPVAILDTMIFEIQRGRACENVRQAQAKELEAQTQELLAKDRMIDLSQNALQASETEASHLRQSLAASEELTRETGRKERRKGRREGAGVIGVIAVVLVLLL